MLPGTEQDAPDPRFPFRNIFRDLEWSGTLWSGTLAFYGLGSGLGPSLAQVWCQEFRNERYGHAHNTFSQDAETMEKKKSRILVSYKGQGQVMGVVGTAVCWFAVAACSSEPQKVSGQQTSKNVEAPVNAPSVETDADAVPGGPLLAPAPTPNPVCASLKPEDVFKVLVDPTSAATPSGYQLRIPAADILVATLAEQKQKPDFKYKRFEVSFSNGVHTLSKPIGLSKAQHSPECGIALRSVEGGLAVLKPEGTLKNWVVYRDDIVRTQVPGTLKVTGLSYNGELLLRSRFPHRDSSQPVGKILDLNEVGRRFRLELHESSSRLLKAFASSAAEGDPQIWIPGTGSIYIFDIASTVAAESAVVAVAPNDVPHTVAFKCMQFKAQTVLTAEEREACRSNPGNSNLAHKEVWRGIKPNHPFFLENHVEFISAAGEWAFDAETRSLFLRLPKSVSLENLNAQGVNFVDSSERATRMQNLFQADGIEHLSLDGIRFEGAPFVHQEPIFAMARGAVSTAHLVWNAGLGAFEKRNLQSAVEIRNSNFVTLKHNEFSGLDGVGVSVVSGVGHQVESNLFRDIGFSSFEMLDVSSAKIQNNVFRNIGVRGVGDAVRVSGTQLRIENNDIYNSLRGGIQVAGTWCAQGGGLCGIIVKNNVLQNVITGGLTDYGAIYINSISHEKVLPTWRKAAANARVSGNVIKNVKIAGFYPHEFEIEGPTGIYLDSGSKQVVVFGNELSQVHNAFNQNCSDANSFVNNGVNSVQEMQKSMPKYASQSDWAKKCVAVDSEWAPLEGFINIRNNGAVSPARTEPAGLTSEERKFWISRGVSFL